jgi:hypothetical protein
MRVYGVAYSIFHEDLFYLLEPWEAGRVGPAMEKKEGGWTKGSEQWKA